MPGSVMGPDEAAEQMQEIRLLYQRIGNLNRQVSSFITHRRQEQRQRQGRLAGAIREIRDDLDELHAREDRRHEQLVAVRKRQQQHPVLHEQQREQQQLLRRQQQRHQLAEAFAEGGLSITNSTSSASSASDASPLRATRPPAQACTARPCSAASGLSRAHPRRHTPPPSSTHSAGSPARSGPASRQMNIDTLLQRRQRQLGVPGAHDDGTGRTPDRGQGHDRTAMRGFLHSVFAAASQNSANAAARAQDAAKKNAAAAASLLERLPTYEVREPLALAAEPRVCPICLDDICVGSHVTQLPCGHEFHKPCIGAWLGKRTWCPLCKQSASG